VFVVFLHGRAASGKLTVGKELSAITGLPLFHNHLTVDLALSLFEFGSPPFRLLRDEVWLAAFSVAAKAGRSFIFTFHPEATVTFESIERLVRVVEAEGGAVHFVSLECPEEEVERRIGNPSRAAFGKLTSVEQYRQLRDAGRFAFPPLPEPIVRVHTDEVDPRQAARRIAEKLTEIGAV
jgi:hypothetical protein